MFFNVALLIGLGVVCLIKTVVALIFGVIELANKRPSKFIWLTIFLCSLIGMIICIVMVVRKAVHAVENFTENSIGQFENYTDSLPGHLEVNVNGKHEISPTSSQIKVLKSYLSSNILNNEPEEFYTYSGFKDYYRYPLRYPFSIHCINSKENGELYNEVTVNRFDENDNGETFSDRKSVV